MSELLKDPAPPPADVEGGEDAVRIPGDLPPEIQQQIKEHQESIGNKAVIEPAPSETPPDSPPEETPGDAPDEDEAVPPK
jgi:hypothetical protein